MRLIQINNKDENAYINNKIEENGLSSSSIWYGGRFKNNQWVGETDNGNKAIQFTDWAPGEPNVQQNRKEFCLQHLGSSGHKWNDDECELENGQKNRLRYICERTRKIGK